ncbi:MAG: hypothetical protein HYZ45_13630 [Burkholderiales bacterium]|nr:hypothetical protein [Burkholderiales bacterium]
MSKWLEDDEASDDHKKYRIGDGNHKRQEQQQFDPPGLFDKTQYDHCADDA